MAYPKYSFVLTTAVADGAVTITSYTTTVAAKAAFATALADATLAIKHLYLEAGPSRSVVPQTLAGTFTDAFGAVRVVGDADSIA
jgi:hypothetical protein